MLCISGLILAAGESRRMGTDKALLEFPGGKTLLEDQVSRIKEAGIDNIYVVVGCNAEEIKNRHSGLDISWAENTNWKDGNFSSIVCGVKALNSCLSKRSFAMAQDDKTSEDGIARRFADAVTGVLLLPVDVVGVDIETIRAIIKEGVKSDQNIIPTFEGHGGHPVYLGTELIKDILSHYNVVAGSPVGRLDLMLRNSAQTKRFPVSSENIRNNINIAADWKRYLEGI